MGANPFSLSADLDIVMWSGSAGVRSYVCPVDFAQSAGGWEAVHDAVPPQPRGNALKLSQRRPSANPHGAAHANTYATIGCTAKHRTRLGNLPGNRRHHPSQQRRRGRESDRDGRPRVEADRLFYNRRRDKGLDRVERIVI